MNQVRRRTLIPAASIVVVLLTVASGPALAQAQPAPHSMAGPETIVRYQPTAPRNGLHLNPLQMAMGVFGLGYERVLGDHVALQISGQYTRLWFSEDDAWGVGGQVKPMVFFFRPAPGGMYLSPFFSAAYSRATVDSAVGEGFGYAAGATVGYSWVIGQHFNIRAGGGVQYFNVGAEAGSGSSKVRVGFRGVLPALDFSLGVLF